MVATRMGRPITVISVPAPTARPVTMIVNVATQRTKPTIEYEVSMATWRSMRRAGVKPSDGVCAVMAVMSLTLGFGDARPHPAGWPLHGRASPTARTTVDHAMTCGLCPTSPFGEYWTDESGGA